MQEHLAHYHANSVQYNEANPDVYTTSNKYKYIKDYQQEDHKITQHRNSQHQPQQQYSVVESYRPKQPGGLRQPVNIPINTPIFDIGPPLDFTEEFSFPDQSSESFLPEHHQVKKSVVPNQYYGQHKQDDSFETFSFPEDSFNFFENPFFPNTFQ